MIFTSYYANINRITDLEPFLNLLGISTHLPHWVPGRVGHFAALAPPVYLVKKYKNGVISPDEYTCIYTNTVLKSLDPFKLGVILRNSVLLCYERPDEFCHRHVVRNWFNQNGIACEELDVTKWGR